MKYLSAVVAVFWTFTAFAGDTNVILKNFPAYDWEYGCVGTAAGMIMGYFDANGFPDLYTGTINGGVAPASSSGNNIYALWASRKNIDGKTGYGHVDDYWTSYESEATDPWHARGYEHEPDCIGDFMGSSQNKWTNMNDECDGNKDAWTFNYFDPSGARRVNYRPGPEAGLPCRDIQSGLRDYAAYCGYAADSFSQLADVWHDTPAGTGFTFEDLRAEIDAGYPVMLYLQTPGYTNSTGFNPGIHAVVAAGYSVNSGTTNVILRWGWSALTNQWSTREWTTNCYYTTYNLYLRGVIGFRPKTRLNTVSNDGTVMHFSWDGATGARFDRLNNRTLATHWHVLECTTSLVEQSYTSLSTVTVGRACTVTNDFSGPCFMRVRHVP